MRREKYSRRRSSKLNLVPVVSHRVSNDSEDFPDLQDARRSSGRERLRSAYAVKSFRMYAPFITQLSTQYDPVEIQRTERQERRKLAQSTYEQNRTRSHGTRSLKKRYDLKI